MFDETSSLVPAESAPAVGSNSLPELAALIRDEHTAVEQAKADGLEHAHLAGEFLNEAKPLVTMSGKKWMDWVKENCGFSHSTANKYMRVAKMGIRNAVPNLSFREAVKRSAGKKSGGAPASLRKAKREHDEAIVHLDRVIELLRSRQKGERVNAINRLLVGWGMTVGDLGSHR
jgi:hypothetical protein